MNKPRKGAGGQWVVDVDGHEYAFQKFGAVRALDILSCITGVVGRPLGAMLGRLTTGKGLATEVTPDLAQEVIGSLTRRMRKHREDVMTVLQALTAENVFCDGKQVKSFDAHFEDRLDHMFRVAYAGMEVQYGSFFAAVRDAVGLRPDTAAVSTQASATSTG